MMDRDENAETQPLVPLFVRTFTPAAIIVLLLSALMIRVLYENELSLIRLNEQALLELSAASLQKNLQSPQRDLLSLRRELPVIRSLSNPETQLKDMENSFASLLSRNPNYFQIRWINEQGQEQLRLEPAPQRPEGYHRVANTELQNKSDRYYVRETLNLEGTEQLYLSPMDLNVELGVIEQPYRPTLRMAIPVSTKEQHRGLFVINIDAREYLSDLQQVLQNNAHRLQVLSPEGYWLKHKEKKWEWGFQLNHNASFKSSHPDVWQNMHHFRQRQLLNNSQLWSWIPLYPNTNPNVFNNRSLGFLVLQQPKSVIHNLRLQYWGGGSLISLLLLTLAGTALYRLFKAQHQQQKSERKALQTQIKAEQLGQQQESEKRFRVIFNASHTPLLVCDKSGKIALVNPALEKLFGYTALELTGLPVEHLIPKEYQQQHTAERKSYLRAPRPRAKMMKNGQSLQGVRKSGQRVDVEVGLSPYESDGEVFILATIEDIGARLKAERQLKELHHRQTQHLEKVRKDAEHLADLKSRFLANMSHEIRTPLNAIMALGELLQQEPLTEDAKAICTKMQYASDSLLHIINDVLDFSKIEAEGLSLEQIPFTLGDVFDLVLAVCQAQADKKPLKLHLDADEGCALILSGDPYRLGQTLTNLVSNAIKFTEEGEVTISSRTVEMSQSTVCLKFSVSDTGQGIAPEQQEIIFNAFAQADSSITREFGGTGLGLAISRKLIQLMGGQLVLSSQLGKGSTFSFSLNYPIAEKKPAKQNISTAESLKGKTILIVDDSSLNREIAQRVIQQAEGKALVAENGLAALDLLKTAENTPDLILMDLQMPVMDGFQATEQIKMHSKSSHIPVIALTADVTANTHKKALASGASQVLTKPFTIQQILTCLKNHLPVSAVKEASLGPGVSESPASLSLFDETAAISNWGDQEALQHFLHHFFHLYGDITENIEHMLANQDEQKACALAHKAKGAASNLYLLALSHELGQLEQALSEENSQSETIKTQLLNRVSAKLTETKSLISASDTSATDSNYTSESDDTYASGGTSSQQIR